MTRAALAAFACLTVAACAEPQLPLSPDYGEAVANNIRMQVVNPLPPPPRQTVTDGQRLEHAYERYVNNKVYPPRLPIERGVIQALPVKQAE
jgi:hypothetical protein